MAKKNIKHRRRKMQKRLLKKRNAELDLIFNDFVSIVNKERDCNRCGMCCNSYDVLLTHNDLAMEPELNAASRSIKESERKRCGIDSRFIKVMNTETNSQRCPLYWDDLGCSVYENRPELCRNYAPTLNNCFKSRLGYAGFILELWGSHNITEYHKTKLHLRTGLRWSKDYKTICLYSLIMPYLASEEKIRYYHTKRRSKVLIPADSTIERLIDFKAEIPDWIRDYLQLDDRYLTILDIFKTSTQPIDLTNICNQTDILK